MSKIKPGEAVVITGEQLGDYVKSTSDVGGTFTTMATVLTYTQTEGLAGFNAALGAAKEGDDFAQFKDEHQNRLLQDIERLSKKKSVFTGYNSNPPKFQQSFYKEIKKPASERSEEYKKFIQHCNERASSGAAMIAMGPESISIRALAALDAEGARFDSVTAQTSKGFEDFAAVAKHSTKKDISDRGIVYYKDERGEVHGLSNQEFSEGKTKNGQPILLTPEQKEFIEQSWNQSTFVVGWVSNSVSIPVVDSDGRSSQYGGRAKGTVLLIDQSLPGKTILSNSATILANALGEDGMPVIVDDKPVNFSAMQASIEVDITSLQGDKFVPGCAASAPGIKIEIAPASPDLAVVLPEGLQHTTRANAQQYAEIENLSIEAAASTLVAQGEKSGFAVISLREIGGIEGDRLTQVFATEESLQEKMRFVRQEFSDPRIVGAFEQAIFKKAVGILLSDNIPQEQKINAVKAIEEITNNGRKLDDTKAKEVVQNLQWLKNQNNLEDKMFIVMSSFADEKAQKAFLESFVPELKDQSTIRRMEILASKVQDYNNFQNLVSCGETSIKSELSEPIFKLMQQEGYQKADPQGKMNLANQVIKDEAMKKKFAVEYIGQAMQKADGSEVLNKQEYVKEQMKGILSPLCKNDKERERMQKNVDKMVQKMSEGKENGWTKKWNEFKERVKEVVDKVMGRENLLQNTIKQHPELVAKLRQNLQKSTAKAANVVLSNTGPHRGMGEMGR